MDSLLVAVPALGCALMMVPMIWLMSRGMKQDHPPTPGPPSPPPATRDPGVAELQAEVERLRAEVRGPGPVPQPPAGETTSKVASDD